MKQTLTWLQRAENLILGAAFIMMVLAMFTQVVNRNFTKLPLPWTEEVAVYSMIYLVMLGTEAGLRDGTQIQITAVVDKFKGRTKLGIQLVAKLIVVLFSGVMAWASFGVVSAQASSGQTSPVLRVPIFLPFGAFLLAFTVIVIVQTVALIRLVRAFVANDPDLALGAVATNPDEVEEISAALGVESEIDGANDTETNR